MSDQRRKDWFDDRVSTTDGRPPQSFETGAPGPIDPRTGQHAQYWVLSEAERAKGFVRPVRRSYRHVGPPGPQYPLRDLTAEECERQAPEYVKFEEYPESERPLVGRFWTRAQLDGPRCSRVTTMGQSLAETYARDPKFYGATFCAHCGAHFPVADFVWDDGSGQRVGS